MLSSNFQSLLRNDYVPSLFYMQALFVPLALGEIKGFLNITFLLCSSAKYMGDLPEPIAAEIYPVVLRG